MILNGKMINPGELRTPIILLRREMTDHPGGFKVQATKVIGQAWARWQNVHGVEAWTTSTQQAQQAATVLLRYRPDVDTTCLVQRGPDVYEIVSLDNIMERGEYLELEVKRLVEG